ncbi:MAG: TIR-like protein FxsC [Streptosporangiaceae bacterium]
MTGLDEHQDPYFFLSYARMRHDSDPHPDKWIIKFFRDLCADISHLTGSENPGFMDQQQLRIGAEWSTELTEALATCKVFLPIYSPRYFNSEYCGREWAIFNRRLEKHAVGGPLPTAIIPAMWIPMDLDKLPMFAGTRQLSQPDLPQHYLREGLYGIMKLGKYREAYKETVLGLARAIVFTADSVRLARLGDDPHANMKTVDSAFADFEHTGHRIRLTVAACDLDCLPEGRGPYYYGRRSQEWNPYRSAEEHTPITPYAVNVISQMGHRPEVQELGTDPPDGRPLPDVMLVDAWATDNPHLKADLSAADESPMVVLLPSHQEDLETEDQRDRLDRAVGSLLGRALARPGSARWVPSETFRSAFIRAVNEAISHHLKTVPVEDPPPAMPRPRLAGPGPGG